MSEPTREQGAGLINIYNELRVFWGNLMMNPSEENYKIFIKTLNEMGDFPWKSLQAPFRDLLRKSLIAQHEYKSGGITQDFAIRVQRSYEKNIQEDVMKAGL